MFPKNNITKTSGYTLLEILVYASLLALVIALMANSIASLTRVFITIKEERVVRASAEAALERIVREVRFAKTINMGASTLNAHPGVLVLTTIDPFTEVAQTITFSINNNRVAVQKNADPVEYLTSDDFAVTNLVFRHMTNSTISEAIRTELTIDGKNFYTTTVLRRSY